MARTGEEGASGPSRSPVRLALFLVPALLALVGLVLLGNWQVARRTWKLDLIERVETRVHAPPVPAPSPPAWPGVTAATDEYRHVQVAGHFLSGQGTFVQATTALGAGFWLLEPFRTGQGFVVLVNRGFVPGERSTASDRAAPPPPGELTVTGLLRLTEPGGGFLRSNDPAADRWHSRDVAAIVAARGLAADRTAPYFIDAEATPGAGAGSPPVAGLTVIAFPNTHLVYAITWYALALMLAGATCYVVRAEWRMRRSRPGGPPRGRGDADGVETDRTG